jgi:hypothetical protein
LYLKQSIHGILPHSLWLNKTTLHAFKAHLTNMTETTHRIWSQLLLSIVQIKNILQDPVAYHLVANVTGTQSNMQHQLQNVFTPFTNSFAFRKFYNLTTCFDLYGLRQVLKLLLAGNWCASFMLV